MRNQLVPRRCFAKLERRCFCPCELCRRFPRARERSLSWHSDTMDWNRATITAMQAARRGELVTVGPEGLIK